MNITTAQDRAEEEIVASTYGLLESQAALVLAMLRKQTDRPLSDPRVQKLLHAIVAEWADRDGVFHKAWIETLAGIYVGLVAMSVKTLVSSLPDFELAPSAVNSATTTLALDRATVQASFITQTIASDFAAMVNRVGSLGDTMTVADTASALTTSAGGLIGPLSPERIATRAASIAATEAPSWLNQSRDALVVAQGFYTFNTWRTENDELVRLTHMLQEGERQPVGNVFANGCRFPGDPQADISEIARCRCHLEYST